MADTLQDILGLPQECPDFTDGQARMAHPIKMRDFPSFIQNFQFINVTALWNNMLFEEGVTAVKNVLGATFVPNAREISEDEYNEQVDALMDTVNAGNFPKIIKLITEINGIKFNKEEDEKNVEKV